MLGNDVVDLLDVDARPETFHRRFDQRVYREDERRAIAADPSPHALRWTLWAAKEAGYKCLRQCDPRLVFSPIRLEARFDRAEPGAVGPDAPRERRGLLRVVPDAQPGEGAGRRSGDQAGGQEGAAASRSAVVRAPWRELELRGFETADWVHVVAQPAGRDWSTVRMAVEALGAAGEDASLAVRRLARREIARAFGVEEARVEIGRRDRIPTLELDGATMPIPLSLSHHGRFVAYAMAPRGRAPRGVARAGSARDDDETSARKRVSAIGSVGYPASAPDTKRTKRKTG